MKEKVRPRALKGQKPSRSLSTGPNPTKELWEMIRGEGMEDKKIL